MDKFTASKLTRLKSLEIQNALAAYVEYREAVIKEQLLYATPEAVVGLQQSYQEIRRLKTLGDEIAKALKE